MDTGTITVGEVWSLFSLAVVFTALRIYARVKVVGVKGLQAEDYLASVAMLFYCAEATIAHKGSLLFEGEKDRGIVPGQTPSAGREPTDRELDVRATGNKMHFAMSIIYPATLWLLKLSILRVLVRLTSGLAGRFRQCIYFGLGFLAVSWVTIILTVFLSCRPFLAYFDPVLPKPDACKPAGSPPVMWTTYTLNIITDLFLIAVPMPLLWNTSMKTWKKVGLVILFSAGAVIIVFATIRVVQITKVEPRLVAPVSSTWAVRESFVAIITTNFPMVFTLVRGFLGQAFSQFRTTNKSQSKPSNQTYGGSTANIRKPRYAHNPTATNVIFTESEEQIVKGEPMMGEDQNYPNAPAKGGTDIEMTTVTGSSREEEERRQERY